jgi:hypothetical protein
MPAGSQLSGGVFHKLSVAEFTAMLSSLTPRRRIDAVHLHHTWRPRHRDYKGLETIVSMWRFHTQERKWSDIAQHLTVAPDGDLWTGRHWDLPPASASGHNGSLQAGPFMIEMIGDFDAGADTFAGAQRDAVQAVIAALLARFELPASAIRFHNEMSSKSCPGTAIDRAAFIGEVDAVRAAQPRDVPSPRPSPFDEKDDALWHAAAFLRGARDGAVSMEETCDAELPESASEAASRMTAAAAVALETAAMAGRGVDVTLTPEINEALRPHVVNLTRGRFSTTGEFRTSQADVDRIFDEHLPNARAAAAGAPLRIVVYAHGGLVGELDGLGVALKHVDWWRRNGVYPIYFAWETDFLGALLNAIRGAIDGQRELAGARGLLDVIDAQIEAAARKVKASSIWADMKQVAELSSAADGGARYVAGRLAAFCTAHPQVEVHAVGHSAGSNFHSYFIPVALDAGVPAITTLQLLAPAVSVDGFFSRLAPRLGSVGPLTIYTMKDSYEQADDCKRVYNKSLLYLVSRALEDRRDMDLLGLEISIRNDLRLRRMFGLDGNPSPRRHEIVWSVTSGDRRASSASTTHGGFDDDPATMNSVARRVLGLTGAQELAAEFVPPSRSVDAAIWSEGVPQPPMNLTEPPSDPALAAAPAVLLATAANGGRRRALCVGINTYRRKPLSGCVADAERWADTLAKLGFTLAAPLHNAQATRDRILRELERLIRQSRSGDVIVFQYAGHGTTLPDADGDEAGGDSPRDDEALCPYDYTEGRFVIDDDLAAMFDAAPDGVLITSFIDCCHSGTITRFGAGPVADGSEDDDTRARYLEADAEMIDAHLAFRAGIGARAVTRRRPTQRDVLFAACRSTEVAWESRNQGDFTRHATAVLRAGGRGLSNGALLSRIQAAFGASPRQHPELHPASAAARPLFGARGNRDGDVIVVPPELAPGRSAGDTAALLRAIADFIGG